jgi:HD-GYP domain-containing protein (c-di-GMP phosphodiesterase class II)
MDRESLQVARGSDLYTQLLQYIREQTESVGRGELIDITDTVYVARCLIDDYHRSTQLLETAMGFYDPVDFVVSHAANVAIYALKMATDMGLSEGEVEETVLAGILHDVGFSRVPIFGIDEKALLGFEENPGQALTEEDYRLVNLHPAYGHDAIASNGSRSKRVAEILLQHHEKADGSGYPNGLRESEQHVQARIISIIDTWEALIHPRPLRDALVPPKGIEAIKNQAGGVYSSEMLKELINSFSLYPVGHFIRLGDGSIGKVIETRTDNPCRPVVELLFDQKGMRIDPPIQVDLRKNNLIRITECLPRFRQN